jgi:molybdate transport system substrate-binding protein
MTVARRAALTALAGAAALAWPSMLAGCGGSGRPALEISAAASLTHAFRLYGQRFRGATVHYSFAGSDTLAAQIEEGIRPDAFASANSKLPAKLYARGLVERPVAFAANRLVLAVPARSSIHGLEDLARRRVTIAIGTPGVPVGSYAETVLARLPPAQRARIMGEIRDREPSVTGIVGKLTFGAVDAGFLYATDVAASGGALRGIPLPPSLEPSVTYAAAVVRGTRHAAQARAFIDGLLQRAGQADLQKSGFLPPP